MKRSISALAAAVACAAVCAGPAAARTADSTPTQLCSKVSASAVSSAIGYSVPAGSGTADTQKGTKTNDFISGSTLICIFGHETSLAAIKKAVTLDFETVSKSLSTAEIKLLIAKTAKITGGHFKIVPYSGLSGQSFLMTFSEGGITVESLVSANGTKLYGATVYGTTASSKLATLVKLAEKL